MKKLIIVICLFWACVSSSFAADHYVSPAGSASWANSTNILTPCSFATALSSVQAGDTVYFRGGTYTINASVITNYENDGTSGSRIIYKNYPGETPDLVFDAGGDTAWYIDSDYVTIDGLTIHGSNFNAEGAIIKAGDSNSATYLIVQNCHIHMTGANSADNVDCISLKAFGGYALIQNNEICGYITDSSGPGGVYQTGGHLGVKVLKNNIHTLKAGLYCKHVNGDTSFDTGYEWAYNYIYNVSSGLMGIPGWLNCHDNIVSGISESVYFGTNGGGANGTNSLINHNHLIGNFLTLSESGGMINYTIQNNIISSRELYGGSGNTWDYNMYLSGTAIGAHDQANTSPTYVGGASPSTIAGFALATGSAGENDGSDSKDLGADISLVGTLISSGSFSGSSGSFSGAF